MDRSDAELVAAASRGDSVAFGELAGRHERRLRQLARTVLGDPAEAEDVAQDAILAAYLDLGRLRDPERFGSWLYGIGLNLARMRVRARPSRSGAEARFAPESTEPTPEQALEAAELLALVRQALEVLPPAQRDVVLLHYYEGLTCEEIAAVLGRSTGAVRVRLHRARGRLRDQLSTVRPKEVPTMVEMTFEDVVSRADGDGEPVEQARRVVLLREREGSRVLPIWIGAAEGDSLALHLGGESLPRPLTSDLTARLLEAPGPASTASRSIASARRRSTRRSALGTRTWMLGRATRSTSPHGSALRSSPPRPCSTRLRSPALRCTRSSKPKSGGCRFRPRPVLAGVRSRPRRSRRRGWPGNRSNQGPPVGVPRIQAPVAILDRAIVNVLPAVPKGVVRRISSRYIAGTDLQDACRVVSRLNAAGKLATIDVLGEEITSVDEATGIAREYRYVFETIDREHLDSNVSVKLTALGLNLSYSLCRRNLEQVVRHAAEIGNFVRIDMEDSSTTDDTLRLYRELREAGLDNVGVVLQARLRRTLADVEALADLTPNVRICKGIYIEPAELAFQEFEEVRANFVAVLHALLESGSYVGIATHDEWLLDEGKRLVAEHGRTRERYEFQMLLGVRERLGDALVAEGHRLRIYVPYGEHWYAYSLRRLQENPKIAGYIAADTFGRLIPGRNGS